MIPNSDSIAPIPAVTPSMEELTAGIDSLPVIPTIMSPVSPDSLPSLRNMGSAIQIKPTDPTMDSSAFPSGDGLPTTARHDFPRIPGYHIEIEIGRGGMGVVYRATQIALNRVVALKMILSTNPEEMIYFRFRAEAEAIARLQHPNIIHVYEIGEQQGRPWFSLEYCPRGTLEKRINSRPIPNQEAGQIMEKLAHAVHTAHLAGVIHRDLKPANVLLSGDGTPKVTDFGIARRIDVDASNTQTGAIIGTPGYMSPEQASGKIHEIGPATDVYALGAILYECLTGRPPFVAANPLDIITLVTQQEPLPPRILNPKADDDLEKITLKCLEKVPADRYATAQELADDLHRWLNGESITARSVNILERLQRELLHTEHDNQLRPWGTALIGLGGLIFVSHLATSLMIYFGLLPFLSFWIPRTVMLSAVVWGFLKHRSSRIFMPTNTFERTIWAVWVGYVLAFISLFWTMQIQGHDHLQIYGAASTLSGMVWFVMGGYVWGGCYLLGLGFIAMAPLMGFVAGSAWSPFTFGAMWATALITLGRHYRKSSTSGG